LVTYFNLGCSNVSEVSKVQNVNDKYIYIVDDSVHLQVTNSSDIMNIIIPFFEKYPIQGIKSLDFADFKKVSEIIKKKRTFNSRRF